MGGKMPRIRAVAGLQYKFGRLKGEIDDLRVRERKHETLAGHAEQKMLAHLKAIDDIRNKIQSAQAELNSLSLAADVAFGVDLSQTPSRKTIPHRHTGSHGELTRRILGILGSAGGTPMTTFDIAERILQTAGVSVDRSAAELQTAVRYALKRLRKNGTVRRLSESLYLGGYSQWALAESFE
jgi:hypothetical protein